MPMSVSFFVAAAILAILGLATKYHKLFLARKEKVFMAEWPSIHSPNPYIPVRNGTGRRTFQEDGPVSQMERYQSSLRRADGKSTPNTVSAIRQKSEGGWEALKDKFLKHTNSTPGGDADGSTFLEDDGRPTEYGHSDKPTEIHSLSNRRAATDDVLDMDNYRFELEPLITSRVKQDVADVFRSSVGLMGWSQTYFRHVDNSTTLAKLLQAHEKRLRILRTPWRDGTMENTDHIRAAESAGGIENWDDGFSGLVEGDHKCETQEPFLPFTEALEDICWDVKMLLGSRATFIPDLVYAIAMTHMVREVIMRPLKGYLGGEELEIIFQKYREGLPGLKGDMLSAARMRQAFLEIIRSRDTAQGRENSKLRESHLQCVASRIDQIVSPIAALDPDYQPGAAKERLDVLMDVAKRVDFLAHSWNTRLIQVVPIDKAWLDANRRRQGEVPRLGVADEEVKLAKQWNKGQDIIGILGTGFTKYDVNSEGIKDFEKGEVWSPALVLVADDQQQWHDV